MGARALFLGCAAPSIFRAERLAKLGRMVSREREVMPPNMFERCDRSFALHEQCMNGPVTLLCVRERTHHAYDSAIVVNSGESSMKSLAYVFAALLALAIAAPSVASAHEHHHHHHHHHHMHR
jgi:hypothetical protein